MNVRIDVSRISLETDRLILRPFMERDLKDLYDYASVEGVGEMAGWCHHSSIKESQRILKMFIEEKKTFALYAKETKQVIGSLGLETYDEKYFKEFETQRGVELGYVLSKKFWGKGLMLEAVRTVIQYLFEEQELDFITCSHFITNSQSKRVIEKSGFQFMCEGEYEGATGKFKTLEYVIRKEEYQNGKF